MAKKQEKPTIRTVDFDALAGKIDSIVAEKKKQGNPTSFSAVVRDLISEALKNK